MFLFHGGRVNRVGLIFCSIVASIASVAAMAESIDYSYDPLGRLTQAVRKSAPEDPRTVTVAYDAAGNRTAYAVATPTPVATATSTNQPPTAVADSVTMVCYGSKAVYVLSNDSDPEGNTPLVLKSVTRNSGNASANVTSGTYLSVTTDSAATSVFTYTVADSLGSTSTATLTVKTNTSGCSGNIN